jgi:hypothetical protein
VGFLASCVPSAVCAALLCGGFAAAAERSLPRGYTAVRPDSGTGEVLIAQVKDARSARDLLAKAMDDLSEYFDGRPEVLGAVGDDADKAVQATFKARRGGKAVEGLALVSVGPRDAVVGLAYDRPAQFVMTKADLADLLAKNLPESAAAPKPQLKPQRLPDDSGAIAVPDGWKLNAVNSMVDAVGPKSEGHFGLWVPVYTPAGAAYMRSVGVDPRGLPIAARGEPEAVLKAVAPQLAAFAGGEWKFKKRLDAADAPGFPGQAQFLLFDADVTVGDKTTTYRTLALIDVMPETNGQFVLYSSWVCAPVADFDRELQTLVAVWKSWKTDDRVFQARLDKALKDMKETYRIIQDVNAERQRAMDRAVDDWSEVIRGTSQVLDRRFGDIHEVDSYELDKLIRGLNEHEGYERWKIIPLKDLNNP